MFAAELNVICLLLIEFRGIPHICNSFTAVASCWCFYLYVLHDFAARQGDRI